MPAASRHAPAKMTREYNRAIALSKVDMAPLDKLDDANLASISRTHKVPVAVLQARLDARLARAAS